VSLALVLMLAVVSAAQSADATVKFYWAAQVSSGTKADRQYSFPGDEVLSLKTGDGIQFYFSPVTRSFAYLLHVRPDQTVTQLFPKSGGSAALGPGDDRYLPGPDADARFVLDKQVGMERLYLIVSAQRLESLEAALRANAGATGKARKTVAGAVLAEIGRLRALHPEATGTVRPTTIAGTFRGGTVDPATHATEVSAANLIVRAYIIEHK
jgi:hypothetical protein